MVLLYQPMYQKQNKTDSTKSRWLFLLITSFKNLSNKKNLCKKEGEKEREREIGTAREAERERKRERKKEGEKRHGERVRDRKRER